MPGLVNGVDMYTMVWRCSQIVEATAASSFVRKTLVDNYPRLRSLLLATLSKLRRNTGRRGGGGGHVDGVGAGAGNGAGATSHTTVRFGSASLAGVAGREEDADRLLWVAQALLEVYLARSLSRLSDPVGMLFPDVPSGLGARSDVGVVGGTAGRGRMNGGSASTPLTSGAGGGSTDLPDLPSRSDIHVFLKMVSSELHACREDVGMSLAVGRGVVAATKVLIAKAQAAAVTGPRVQRVDDDWGPTPEQRHNASIVARLQQVRLYGVLAWTSLCVLLVCGWVGGWCMYAVVLNYVSTLLRLCAWCPYCRSSTLLKT